MLLSQDFVVSLPNCLHLHELLLLILRQLLYNLASLLLVGLSMLLFFSLGFLDFDGVFEGRHPREVLALADGNFEDTLLRLELTQLVLERDQSLLFLINLAK